MPDGKLVGMDGKPFSLAALHGKWVWLYFGFTHCPDVCPTTLGQLATAYRALHAPAAVRVVFISVDPARDTPAALARDVTFYNKSFWAATGDRPTLDALTTAVGARFAYGPTSKGDYDVSHSNLIFVLDPAGRLAATYLPDAGTDGLRADFDAIGAAP